MIYAFTGAVRLVKDGFCKTFNRSLANSTVHRDAEPSAPGKRFGTLNSLPQGSPLKGWSTGGWVLPVRWKTD
jgi:hypothetical protein